MDSDLEYCRKSFERDDYPHYLISLLMPRDKRPALWTLGAFKNVIEAIPLSVTEPALGYMRLTWWRDQIELMEQGRITQSQPVLAALKNHCRACESKDLTDFINEQESVIENPEAELMSSTYPKLLESILGADISKYRKLEDALTRIMKSHHGTKWEKTPPFMALRLWWMS